MVPVGGIDETFQAAWVAYELVKEAHYLIELGPAVPVLLPAVHHEVVESCGAVHRAWQPVALLYSLYHLIYKYTEKYIIHHAPSYIFFHPFIILIVNPASCFGTFTEVKCANRKQIKTTDDGDDDK